MQLSDFRTLVLAYSQVEGQPYLTANADVDTLINEKLREFARRTRCFYTPSAAFALQGGVSTYNLEGSTNPVVTSGATEWVTIDYVTLNGNRLLDPCGRYEAISLDELHAYYPDWMATTAGTPVHWVMLPSQQVMLYPTPSTSFVTTSSGKNFVGGYTLPAQLVNDTDELAFVDDTERVAAKYIAAELIGPYASGSSLAKYQRLMQEAEGKMQELRTRYDSMVVTGDIRGWSRPRRWRHLR